MDLSGQSVGGADHHLTFDLPYRITGGPFDQECVSSSHSLEDPDLKVGGA